jgi:TatD DNase family protein
MDLYWDNTFLPQQEKAFRRQIQWAKDMGLPIIIHARNSFNEIFQIMDELNDESLGGIFHCFSGSLEQAEKIIEYGGFKLGIGGVVTFKNAGLDKVVEQLDLGHLVLETDSPYLAPAPFRGKRNETPYLIHIAERIAQLQKTSIEQVAAITTANAAEIFNFEA